MLPRATQAFDLEWLCRGGRCVVIGFFRGQRQPFVHQLFAKAKTRHKLVSQPVAAVHHEPTQQPLANSPGGSLTGRAEARCGEVH